MAQRPRQQQAPTRALSRLLSERVAGGASHRWWELFVVKPPAKEEA